MAKSSRPDFQASFDGSSLWLLKPLTAAARAWGGEHLPDDALMWAGAIVVEHHYIAAIVEGAANDGLRVRVKEDGTWR